MTVRRTLWTLAARQGHRPKGVVRRVSRAWAEPVAGPMVPAAEQDLRLEYAASLDKLGEPCAARFIQLARDAELAAYLESAERRRLGPWKSLWRRLLGSLLSDFDVNALIQAYPMHLLGTEQWRTLLRGPVGGRLLDVGAGSGEVTAALAPLFDEVITIESSRFAAWRLRQRGWRSECRDVVLDGVPSPPYDAVACLNVLDRCAYPAALIAELRQALVPGGWLLVAMPLPYRPMFFDGPARVDPVEPLPCVADAWEEGARALVERVLLPVGLELVTIARAPYLSGGDTKRTFYLLDDVVVACRSPGDEGVPTGSGLDSSR